VTTPADTQHDGNPVPPELSLGQRFRAAREARGLGIAEVASALHAPQGIVEAMEHDQLDRLGAAVFARGYLTSYARLLDLPTVLVDSALGQRCEVSVPLRSSVHVSRSRYLVDRYARKGAYLVLTASIVLPVIWLATQDQLPVNQLGLRPLDVPVDRLQGDAPLPPAPFDPAVVPDEDPTRLAGGAAPDTIATAESGAAAGPQAEEAGEDVTVVASLAPFYPRSGNRPVDSADGDAWVLRLQQDSWVEIVGRDGRRLEYGLLQAGDERRYPAAQVAHVSVGNASGVSLSRNGEAVDLRPFQRANVARFTVSSDGRINPPGG
jgi:cytoskeleton protein RodZ